MINPEKLLDQLRRNPLVAQLPIFRSAPQLAESLRPAPIDDAAMRRIPCHLRPHCPLPDLAIASKDLLRIHTAQQEMLSKGYARRHPAEPDSVAAIVDLASRVEAGAEIQTLPWRVSDVGGCIVEGLTGTGKSFAIDSFYSQLTQVIAHRNVGECAVLKQLVYLRVHMSADGSRHGFILNALRSMDAALGTDYATQYASRSWTVERLLVVLLYLFSKHRLGALIIEEAQERNLAASFGREFLTFFLRLLNHEVPVVLIGNPLAFQLIGKFTQDAARFSAAGHFRLDPVESADSKAWKADWVPGLWQPRLTTEPDQPFDLKGETLEQVLWQMTGGFPRHLSRLRRESEKVALLRQSESVAFADVLGALAGPEMSGVAPLAAAFANRDLDFLKTQLDVDHAYWAARWRPAPSAPARECGPQETTAEARVARQDDANIDAAEALKRMSAAHRKKHRK